MLEMFYYWSRFCGVWPVENKVADYMKLTINISLMLYMCIGMICFLIQVARDSKATIFNIADNLYFILFVVNFGYVYVVYIAKRKATLDFFKHLCDFTAFGLSKNLAKVNVQANRITKMIIWYGILATSLLNGFYVITYHWYPFGIRYPYNYDNGMSLIIHHVVMWYSFLQIALVGYVYIISNYCAASFLILKINHLNSMLDRVLRMKDTEESMERLQFCIKYHVHIISLVNKLNRAYYEVNIPTTFLYSATVGVCLITFTRAITVKALLMLCGYTLGVSFVCFSGQAILDKSVTIPVTIYNMRWYEADLKFRKCILLMITANQEPLIYRAGPFGYFSLALVGMVSIVMFAKMSRKRNKSFVIHHKDIAKCTTPFKDFREIKRVFLQQPTTSSALKLFVSFVNTSKDVSCSRGVSSHNYPNISRHLGLVPESHDLFNTQSKFPFSN